MRRRWACSWLCRSFSFPQAFIAFLRRLLRSSGVRMCSSGVYNNGHQRVSRFSAQMKHQDRTRKVADHPGSCYPTHHATRYKRKIQCLATIKHLCGAHGSLRSPPVASSAVA
ncbi:hypothetical protein M3J09_010148 [Ascochyta lentis]